MRVNLECFEGVVDSELSWVELFLLWNERSNFPHKLPKSIVKGLQIRIEYFDLVVALGRLEAAFFGDQGSKLGHLLLLVSKAIDSSLKSQAINEALLSQSFLL